MTGERGGRRGEMAILKLKKLKSLPLRHNLM